MEMECSNLNLFLRKKPSLSSPGVIPYSLNDSFLFRGINLLLSPSLESWPSIKLLLRLSSSNRLGGRSARLFSLKPTEPRLFVAPPSLFIHCEKKADLEPLEDLMVGITRSSSSPIWNLVPPPMSVVSAFLSLMMESVSMSRVSGLCASRHHQPIVTSASALDPSCNS